MSRNWQNKDTTLTKGFGTGTRQLERQISMTTINIVKALRPHKTSELKEGEGQIHTEADHKHGLGLKSDTIT